mgnify:FL=1
MYTPWREKSLRRQEYPMPRPARKAARKLVPVHPMGYKKTESQERQTDPPDPGKEKSCQDSWNAQRRPAELPNSLRGLWSISSRWRSVRCRRILSGASWRAMPATRTLPFLPCLREKPWCSLWISLRPSSMNLFLSGASLPATRFRISSPWAGRHGAP